MPGSYLDRLNPEQREAATTVEGPLLVLAGAGTGKTSVITSRIAYMIEQGIPPSSILGVTFTNKAAREMRERIDRLVPGEMAKKVTLGTFHSFCGRILRRDISFAGNYNSSFSIADESDQKSIIRQAAAELGFSKDDVPTEAAAGWISSLKNQMLSPADALVEAASRRRNQDFARIYERYQSLMELQNTVDFDDMLLLTVRIFEEHPEILQRYREIYRYLLVDEYQDTNAAQFRLLQLLTGDAMNLCVVGDDDQSIYAWRGADVRNILSFPELFPGTKTVKLEQNYRSTNRILEAANKVIARNSGRYDKNLWSAKGTGENVQIVRSDNGNAEAAFVINTIRNLVSRGEFSFRDFAILYRSNHLSRLFEQEFRKFGIRPVLVGGQEFFQRKEVKDAAAYLKLLINHRDDQSLLRVISVPPRGIGDKAVVRMRDLQKASPGRSLQEILDDPFYADGLSAAASKSVKSFSSVLNAYREQFRKESVPLAQTVREYLEDSGYLGGLQRVYKDREESEKRQENVLEFISYIGQFEQEYFERHGERPTLLQFIESYSLMDENDRTEDDEDRDAPILSTVHASKGLEYPFVFIVGMENNLFPHERALQENALEEERRLFYVAITRARERLVISWAGERFKFKEYQRQAPSPFLADLTDCADTADAGSIRFEASDEEKRAAFADIIHMLDEDDF